MTLLHGQSTTQSEANEKKTPARTQCDGAGARAESELGAERNSKKLHRVVLGYRLSVGEDGGDWGPRALSFALS